MKKELGILMPLFSLPSQSGIGEMGQECYEWLDELSAGNVNVWQILPLNPVGYGNSPYQPYSSFAGDEIYLSLEKLQEAGLLEEFPVNTSANETQVDYDQVREFKEPYLRQAFAAFLQKGGDKDPSYVEFCQQDWVREYGVYRALKKKNHGNCWNQWPKAERDWPLQPVDLETSVEQEVSYHSFLQYQFFLQWQAVKAAATQRGIQILGDVPFYVGLDSADVWAGRENFLLDAEGNPTFIAGVPPDYFSATGQRWGNPIYDWEHLKSTDFQFWVKRIGYNSQLFDILRIDHFRAFDTYWKISANCPTAVDGTWEEAPGYEVIETLQKKIPGLNLVAEDLGDLRPEVLTLRDYFHLKGMKIIQFCFHFEKKVAYDYFPDRENLIIYTGTHDNDTLVQWYCGLSRANQRKLRKFLKRHHCGDGSVYQQLLTYTLKSQAALAVLPMTDVLGIGAEGHINYPGTVGSPNWQWRLPSFQPVAGALRRLPKR